MSKLVGILKYVFLNIFMAGLTAAFLFTELAGFALIPLVCVGWIFLFISVPLTIEAYRSVCENDEYKGVDYSVLGGFIGGFVAVHTQNKDYAKRTSINVIFNIWLYIAIIYPIMVGILVLTGYYSML